MNEISLQQIIGDPQRLDAGLQKFRKDAKLLSSQRKDLLTRYSNRWVGFHDGHVRADAPTLEQLLESLDELHIPRKEAVIRYMYQNLRRMIL